MGPHAETCGPIIQQSDVTRQIRLRRSRTDRGGRQAEPSNEESSEFPVGEASGRATCAREGILTNDSADQASKKPD